MVTGQGGVPVEAARPSVPRVGLVASALPQPNGEDERWLNGFAFIGLDCSSSGRFDPCATVELVIPENPPDVEFTPYATWAGYKCSPFDRQFEWERAATDLLLANEPFEIASEFWRGDIARAAGYPNRFLTDDALSFDVLDGGAAADPVAALACLESYLGSCNSGQQGMIHASRALTTIWNSESLLRRDGNRMYTIHDTIVVSDGGYDGSGPSANDPDEDPVPAGATQWAYATGVVTVRQEPLTEKSIPNPNGGEDLVLFAPTFGGPDATGMDRATNTVEIRAERRAAATWSGCCHAHVEVDLPVCVAAAS